MRRCEEPLNVSSMLYGMQSEQRCSGGACVCWTLHCWAAARTAEGSAMGNMLYGMQGMSSDVRRCVQCWVCPALGSYRRTAGFSGGGQYAVRYAGHDSDVPEVRSVLGMLPPLLGSCKGAAEGRLRRVRQYAVRYAGRSDVAEVRSVLNNFLHI
jgi:hypothetical protein